MPPKPASFWSDCAASQFKSKEALHGNAIMFMEYMAVIHSFFCSGHGKSEDDDAGVNVKYQAALYKVRTKDGESQLKNSEDLLSFAKARVEPPQCRCYQYRNDAITLDGRKLYLVGADEVSQTRPRLESITGVRKHHQIVFLPGFEAGKMMMRRMTCCCLSCYYKEWVQCADPSCSARAQHRQVSPRRQN